MAVDWWGFAYAAALALGGFMGYKRKGMTCAAVVFKLNMCSLILKMRIC